MRHVLHPCAIYWSEPLSTGCGAVALLLIQVI